MNCATLDGSNQVMAFLSALATPIARRVEIWEPDASGLQLLELARRIAVSVQARFGIAIEPEPRIVGATW